jgi:hypothetical protein
MGKNKFIKTFESFSKKEFLKENILNRLQSSIIGDDDDRIAGCYEIDGHEYFVVGYNFTNEEDNFDYSGIEGYDVYLIHHCGKPITKDGDGNMLSSGDDDWFFEGYVPNEEEVTQYLKDIRYNPNAIECYCGL